MNLRTPQEFILQCSKLKADRGQFERNWQEIAYFMRPLRAETWAPRAPGGNALNPMTDSTAMMAAENFASGIYGMMTNPANRWFALRLRDEDLNNYDPVRDWLYEAETRLLHSFGPQSSRFYAVLPALYTDLACFGTAVFYSEEVTGQGRFNDNVRPLSECYLAENAYGDVDTVYRRFFLTARQALEFFGDNVSSNLRRAAERNDHDPVAFLHCVYANPACDPKSLDPQARPFHSVYIEEEAATTVATGSYFEMPYHTPRWTQAAGEVYGRGIGDQVLPDTRQLSMLESSVLRAAQRMADPPLAVSDKGLVKLAHTKPGGITYGALDPSGQLLVKPIYTGINVGVTFEMMEQRRNAIREAFYFSLLQMAGAPNMTATEWIGRQEEKLRLLGPNLGRIQSEFLSPLIKRRFGMLLRAGQLPEPPPEIKGMSVQIEYVSPLARAQMSGEAQAVGRLYENLTSIAQIDPGVIDNIDHDEAIQVLGRGWAVPAKIMRGSDQVKALRLQRFAPPPT
jgi:hypothetical protein